MSAEVETPKGVGSRSETKPVERSFAELLERIALLRDYSPPWDVHSQKARGFSVRKYPLGRISVTRSTRGGTSALARAVLSRRTDKQNNMNAPRSEIHSLKIPGNRAVGSVKRSSRSEETNFVNGDCGDEIICQVPSTSFP